MSTPDDVSGIASMIAASNGPFRLAAYPLVAPRRRETSRSWQGGAPDGAGLVDKHSEWISREERDLQEVMEHALRTESDGPIGIDHAVEEILIPVHYVCPWWPEARILTALRLAFVTEARIPVLKFGETLLDPDNTWTDVPDRPIPGIPMRERDSPAALANAYARDLRGVFARVFTHTGSDFGSVRVFPLQFRLEDLLERGGDHLHLGWANFIGQVLVDRWGRQRLLETPAHRVEAMEEGGVFIQVFRDLVLKDDAEGWYETIGYLEKITGARCRVDYAFRPDLF
jgi:hypothetical protein